MRLPDLQDVWMMIPDSNCKGLCQKACTAIGMSKREREMIRERIPDFPTPDKMTSDAKGNDDYRCPALVDGRCSVYDVRPTVCRLFGSADSLACPWGCEPTGGRLSTDEASSLFQIAEATGGGMG